MVAAFRGTRRVELDHTVFGKHGRDSFDAEFGRFLHDEVHSLTARNSLYEVDFQRRLGFDLECRFNLDYRVVLTQSETMRATNSPLSPLKTVSASPPCSLSTRPR